jgi:outer membrane protein
MRRFRAAAAAAAMIAIASSSALAVEFGARGAFWFPKLSGDVQTTTGGVTETLIDVKDTLGVEDENVPFGEAFLRAGRLTLRVGYSRIKFDGNKRLSESITFNGETFSVDDNVVTLLDMKMLDGDVQYDILRPDAGIVAFNLGLLLRVKYVDGKVELSSAAAGSTVQDFKAPVPMAGAAVGAGILKNMIRVDLRGAGIAYSGNHLYDVDAYASFTPLPFVRLQGGYRYIDLRIDEDDIRASLKLKGPYVGAQLSF